LRGSGRSEGRQTHDRALVIDRVLLLVRVAVVAEDRDVGGGVLLVVHLAVGRPVLAGGWCRGVEGKGKGRWRGGGRGLRWGAREEGQPAIGPRRHLKGSQADEVGRTVVSWDCAISWVAFGSSGPSRCREENRAPCCPGRQGPAGRLDRARAHDSRTKPRRGQGDPFTGNRLATRRPAKTVRLVRPKADHAWPFLHRPCKGRRRAPSPASRDGSRRRCASGRRRWLASRHGPRSDRTLWRALSREQPAAALRSLAGREGQSNAQAGGRGGGRAQVEPSQSRRLSIRDWAGMACDRVGRIAYARPPVACSCAPCPLTDSSP
jgi:hypothetical protein